MASLLEQGCVYGHIGGVEEATYRVYAICRVVKLDVGGPWQMSVRRRKPRGAQEAESVDDAVRRCLLEKYPDARIESIEALMDEPEEEGDGESPSNQSLPAKRLRLSTREQYSPSGTWGNYDFERTGTRHDRKRDETYDELLRRASVQGVELSTLRGRMDQVFAALRTDDERTAAEVLAEVLMETLDEPDGDADSSKAKSSAGTEALTRESPRTRAGQKLRELLIEVNRLTRQGKTKVASEKMDGLEASAAAKDAKKRSGEDLVNKRAREIIRDVVFEKTGELVLTRSVVEKFMEEMPEVMRPLLPEHLRRSRE